MKQNAKWMITAVALALLLGGCTKKDEAANTQAAAEQKLAEAEQKVAAAQQELDKAREQAAQGPAAGAPRQTQSGGAAGGGAAPVGSGWSQGGKAGQPNAPTAPAPPKTYTVAVGTPISVRTVTALSTKTATNGTPFEATLHEPLVVDGYTVAAKGATVKGIVTTSDPGGRVKGVASMTVSLASIETAGGQVVKLDTTNHTSLAQKSTKKDALKVGIGTGIGAAIGAIAGGGKGAAIGAGAGGAAGTGAVLATRGEAAVLPSESLLTFKLQAPITVTAK
ncbi:MAG TPA: hypothetical protein PKJ41_03415 [Bryobacteraceae bacterium]|nr:hypothetical protein [Bryobacteraceae bacterium]HPT26277.1 hypothetical protein [Bryobacteraceae bacterium]